jgi:hypothetical protein
LTCRAPGPALDPLIEIWPAGKIIHVIHDVSYSPESFNPGIDGAGVLCNPTRFAPVCARSGTVVPYLYGGSSLECAMFETIFHNVPIDAADKFVDLDAFAMCGYGQIAPQRELQLLDLTTDGLHRLKISKAELIDSAPIDYLSTALWAQAIHRQFPCIDGLLWMSRQRDRDQAVMLFGDRVGSALTGKSIGGALKANDSFRQKILTLSLRVGIDAA